MLVLCIDCFHLLRALDHLTSLDPQSIPDSLFTQTMSNLSTSELITTLKLKRYSSPVSAFAIATEIVSRGELQRDNDESFELLEQIAALGLEIGETELSSLCIERLATRFPDSVRVSVLKGMAMESRGEMTSARVYYEELLEQDESRIVSWEI